MKMTVFWDVAPCSLVEIDRRFRGAMMEAVTTSETSVNFYQTTRHNIPEDSRIQDSNSRKYGSIYGTVIACHFDANIILLH
jgi:hypothetical protein